MATQLLNIASISSRFSLGKLCKITSATSQPCRAKYDLLSTAAAEVTDKEFAAASHSSKLHSSLHTRAHFHGDAEFLPETYAAFTGHICKVHCSVRAISEPPHDSINMSHEIKADMLQLLGLCASTFEFSVAVHLHELFRTRAHHLLYSGRWFQAGGIHVLEN